MRRYGAVLGIAFALMSASGAEAASFRLAGDTIAVPEPQGFCEPQGAYIDFAQALAAADNKNLTLLTLYNCAEMTSGGAVAHYALVKTPTAAITQRATRDELLKAMGDIPKSELTTALLNEQVQKEMGENASKVFGRNVAFAGKIVPIDKDEAAFYMGGLITVKTNSGESTGVVVVAMTTIKGHILTYNLYGPGGGTTEIATVLKQAKSDIRSMIAAN